jgi:CRISPR-associated endonuclease Cas1/CRISPR-associated protein Cas4
MSDPTNPDDSSPRSDASHDDAPIPARMLNEVVYCPRLFWLEHVADEWADNADTVGGRRVHRRVDAGRGALPEPDALPDELQARRVHVAANLEGIVAVTDLVEVSDGAVMPVDYKRGALPPEDHPSTRGGVWDADRVQIGAQALALREAGYRVDRAAVWYAASRARVEVVVDETLVAEVRMAVASARELRRLQVAPSPLVDSPKCPRCSLVGICMPDEVNLLRGPDEKTTSSEEPTVEADDEEDPWGIVPPKAERAALRPIAVPKPETRPLYLSTTWAKVSKRGDCLEVTLRDAPDVRVRIQELDHVVAFGNVAFSPQALAELCHRGIPVSLYSYGGWFQGVVESPSHHNVQTRIAQYQVHGDAARRLPIARAIVAGKIGNARVLLRRNLRVPDPRALDELKLLARKAGRAESEQELLGIEGSAAAVWFRKFTELLVPRSGSVATFDFTVRNRRPPRDPVNALLSYGYGLLAREARSALCAAGLDPAVGVYHAIRPGRPSLALDLMEEFRPLVVDSLVMTVINQDELGPEDFVRAAGSANLTDDGRKIFLRAYERRIGAEVEHPLFGYRVSYRRALQLQARLLGRVFTGEIPRYLPFRTR